MSSSINDFSKYTNDIQVHKVKKSNLPLKVTGKHMYFIDNEDGTYSIGVSASDGTIKICSDNTYNLQEQIDILKECELVELEGKSLIEYVKSLPLGTHKHIQFHEAVDTPSNDWYYADIYIHTFNTNYFYVILYTLDKNNGYYHGANYAGNFTGWMKKDGRVGIYNGVDLNICTNINTEYVTASNEVSQSCINVPYQGIPSFRLVNIPLTADLNAPYFRQELISLDGNTYFRHYDAYKKEFGEWDRYITKKEIQALQEQLNATQEMLVGIMNME